MKSEQQIKDAITGLEKLITIAKEIPGKDKDMIAVSNIAIPLFEQEIDTLKWVLSDEED